MPFIRNNVSAPIFSKITSLSVNLQILTPEILDIIGNTCTKPEKAFGLKLAQEGMVTICPRNYLWPTNHKIVAQAEADNFHQRHPDHQRHFLPRSALVRPLGRG